MKYYLLTATLLAPLMVQQNRQTNTPQGLPYLPGSSLRGALAERFFQLGGSPGDEDFRLLFLDHPACFPNLLPADEPGDLSQVLPLTCISCKRDPGFKGQKGHGVKDSLVVTTAGRMSQKATYADFYICPDEECRNEMKPFAGFWNGDTDAPKKFEPTILFQRHTGIDRVTGTAASSIFYTTQAMADFHKSPGSDTYLPQYLTGSIMLDESRFQTLQPLIRDTLYVGADRTRGLGEIKLNIMEIPDPAIDLGEWNRVFIEKVNSVSQRELMSGLYFSLTLASHAIMVDRYLRPATEISFCFSEIEPVLKVAKTQSIRGLPKADDVGLSIGSVFLFQYTGDDQEGLKNFLNRLMNTGIGLRREEGFGRVLLCDPLSIMEVL